MMLSLYRDFVKTAMTPLVITTRNKSRSYCKS